MSEIKIKTARTAYAIISKKSGNIVQWDEINCQCLMFNNRQGAETYARTYPSSLDFASNFEIKEVDIIIP